MNIQITGSAGFNGYHDAPAASLSGANTKMPFSEHDDVDHPLQVCAAQKRANELMAHSCSPPFGPMTKGRHKTDNSINRTGTLQ